MAKRKVWLWTFVGYIHRSIWLAGLSLGLGLGVRYELYATRLKSVGVNDTAEYTRSARRYDSTVHAARLAAGTFCTYSMHFVCSKRVDWKHYFPLPPLYLSLLSTTLARGEDVAYVCLYNTYIRNQLLYTTLPGLTRTARACLPFRDMFLDTAAQRTADSHLSHSRTLTLAPR